MKADITIKQTDNPINNQCATGHIAERTFFIDGKEKETRFFSISGKSINGIYCESCLIAANQMKQRKIS